MRARLLLLVVPAAVALCFGGIALAQLVTVNLTASGPQPATVTVAWGDTISLVNSSGGPQVVVMQRAGITGETVANGETFEVVATGPDGNYNFSQNGSGGRHSGRVVVELTGEVTLAAKRKVVRFGKKTRLTGRSGVPNSTVTIQRREVGGESEWTNLTEAEVSEDGTYVALIAPTVGARYRATAAAGQVRSKALVVGVAPRLLVRLSNRRTPAGTRIKVTAIVAPKGSVKKLDLEVYDKARKRWERIASKRPRGGTRAVFTVKVADGRSRVRVSVRRAGLAPGFSPSASPFATVTGT